MNKDNLEGIENDEIVDADEQTGDFNDQNENPDSRLDQVKTEIQDTRSEQSAEQTSTEEVREENVEEIIEAVRREINGEIEKENQNNEIAKIAKEFFVDANREVQVGLIIGFENGELKEEAMKAKAYERNKDLKIDHLKTDQEKCKLLFEIIKEWSDKVSLACGIGPKEKPIEKQSFGYKTPSSCGGCASAQRLLSEIWGSEYTFNKLPFVKFRGDRQYGFEIEDLKTYAEYGENKTKEQMANREAEVQRKEEEKQAEGIKLARSKNESELNEMLKGKEISEETRDYLLDFMASKGIEQLKALGKDAVIIKSNRSEYGGSGGIGYFDQIHVYWNGQTDMKEWQWRDRYSTARDNHAACINGIGRVSKIQKGGNVNFSIELINKEYGNRMTEFTLKNEKEKVDKLSKEEQLAFGIQVEKTMEEIDQELQRSRELKPQMVSEFGDYTSYRMAWVKEKMIKPNIGRAAFVTEEQIDHRGTDPQMRYEVYMMKHGDEQPKRLTEDHSYEKGKGALASAWSA